MDDVGSKYGVCWCRRLEEDRIRDGNAEQIENPEERVNNDKEGDERKVAKVRS